MILENDIPLPEALHRSHLRQPFWQPAVMSYSVILTASSQVPVSTLSSQVPVKKK